MQDDELMASPPKKTPATTRNALIEDEDGEIRYAHEVTLRTQPKKSPPRQRGDPTIIPRAKQVGVDAQRMHVMQTSLFRQPEEAAAMRANKTVLSSKRLQLLPQPINRKHSRESDGDGLRVDPRERASFAHDIEPLPYRPSRKYARVESSASAVVGNEGAMVDAGLAMGRSFRAGWGPGGTLVHLGNLCGVSGVSKTTANTSIITKTRIPILPGPEAEESERLLNLLTRHLANTPIVRDADGIPFANPSPKLHFASFTSLFANGNRSYEAAVYRLGKALFDDIDPHLGADVTVDIRNRITALRRKAALSAWLADAVAPSVEAALKSQPSDDAVATAFALLTGNQVEKACEVVTDGGNLKLATLLAQAGGDFEFRDDLRSQLEIWREQRVDIHIDESVKKVYALLAGMLRVVDGSGGSGMERCKDVDIFAGLDWKRAFGVHFWFAEPVDATISQAFESYDQQRLEEPERVAGPSAWYVDHPIRALHTKHRWTLPPPNRTPDALFSLIRLHSDPACSLSDILDPLSFGPSPLDYSIPWHLYVILSRCMRVRDFADRGDPEVVSGMPEDSEADDEVEGHSPSADLLASSYAGQLEALGLLQEAVFVLLHIEGSVGREKAIKDLLARQAARLDDWTIRGFCGSLQIPVPWVNEAKAIHALDRGEVYEAYECYLAAQLYNPAHDLAVLELAPDAIIRGDLDLLKELFERVHSRKVENWTSRGKVFLDYVHVLSRLPELHEQVVDTAATELDELARSIPKLIELLPEVLRNRDDPRHNAALAEMISALMTCLDRVKPLALSQTQIKLAMVDDATKLRHIHSTAHERFLRTIQVA
ncbi:hypothetical protein FIBSPDRAFT_856394 [Athelia psychrophila]|uniref:Nuclear pore complex protein NUP96 C-terminal domain-containing protein n=1 Tax=Athelia psychrophila TaxID=1759441 RepID=A0A166NHM9_9AGAM|nr:hypothetical protein FIBSPDRAFT_856394 [Fibularhizoctonia sp. CBS 109695]